MNSNNGIVATFENRYGETRVIHATRHGLKLKRQGKTVALSMSQPIAGLIGQRIRDERQRRGWTLAELCTRSGLASPNPKSRMWEIENAIRKQGVMLGTLYAIAVALGIEVTELLPSNEEVLALTNVTPVQVSSLAVKV